MATVTVPGAQGTSVRLNFDSQVNAVLARQLASSIAQGVQSLSIIPVDQGSGAPPALPPGTIGEYVQSQDDLTILPRGYDIFVDRAPDATVFGSGDPGEAILAGSGELNFVATGGSGTVVGGGGDSTIYVPLTDAGDWSINLGGGNDRVLALGGGNDTIEAGGGRNEIRLGAGNDIVDSQGNDIILGGTGSETVGATGGAHTDLVLGGSSKLLFVGGEGSSTILGGTGSDTVLGGDGTTLARGGSGGNNQLYAGFGQATLFGGGDGDVLYAEGGKAQSLVAGRGNETLVGAGTGADSFHAGGGNDLVSLGIGNDTVIAGTGHATVDAGFGTDVFAFIKGEAGGAMLIQNFVDGDKIKLIGYGDDEISCLLHNQTEKGGSVTVTLSDNTRITLSGVASLTRADFTNGHGNNGDGHG
jgi:Ca2+-binding RTX toxin-like protein